MAEMKLTLKQLTALFARSASDEGLPVPIRQFAAQLTVLTRHVDIERQARMALAASLDKAITELVEAVMTSRQEKPTPVQPGAPATAPISEDDEAQLMAEAVQRETEAELQSIAKEPAAPVTPLRKANGGSAKNAGEVA